MIDLNEVCASCAGMPLEEGRRCICSGLGTAWAEKEGLRKRCLDLEAAIEAFLTAQGNDLCHENRAPLAQLIGRPDLAAARCIDRATFEANCKAYALQIYSSDV